MYNMAPSQRTNTNDNNNLNEDEKESSLPPIVDPVPQGKLTSNLIISRVEIDFMANPSSNRVNGTLNPYGLPP